VGEARIEVGGDTAWWVERTFGTKVSDGVFVTEYSSLALLAKWVLRQDGRAVPQAPDELRREVARALKLVRERHEGAPMEPAAERDGEVEEAAERPAAPVEPERFGVLQALLAYLLDRCGENSEAELPAQELVDRFRIPFERLEEHLSLLNLVNFGGGCYAVYAELDGDTIRVDKELWGDTFRAPPRLTPLEARAIRLALEFVGPMIAADSRTPLDRVRAKLEETFGEFELQQTPEPHVQRAEEDLVGTLSRGLRERRLVELDYLKEGEEEVSPHLVEPYALERKLPFWYVHTWDRTREGERSFRLDRMRSARLQRGHFEPREGFDPHEFRDARPARIWYSPEIARWELEKGARALADGSAVAERPVGSPEWLVGEILSYRGEAVVLEPPELRRQIVERAKAVQRELGLSRVRVA
jgi:proteasome accessory factor C